MGERDVSLGEPDFQALDGKLNRNTPKPTDPRAPQDMGPPHLPSRGRTCDVPNRNVREWTRENHLIKENQNPEIFSTPKIYDVGGFTCRLSSPSTRQSPPLLRHRTRSP